MEDHMAVYTLHGHLGPVTSAFIDKEEPSNACSGSQDGMMCTWDLLTGACVYSIQAHDGALLNLAYSTNYILSMGSDERLCVWERLQGHLINSIYLVSFIIFDFFLPKNNIISPFFTEWWSVLFRFSYVNS